MSEKSLTGSQPGSKLNMLVNDIRKSDGSLPGIRSGKETGPGVAAISCRLPPYSISGLVDASSFRSLMQPSFFYPLLFAPPLGGAQMVLIAYDRFCFLWCNLRECLYLIAV
jgi:hypothetical protein